MTQSSQFRGMDIPRWDLAGLLAYVVVLTSVLSLGFVESLLYPEFALGVLPAVCLAIVWDDHRREVAKLRMPLAHLEVVTVEDPLWDRDMDG